MNKEIINKEIINKEIINKGIINKSECVGIHLMRRIPTELSVAIK